MVEDEEMKGKATRKEFQREIRQSFGRFFSILSIVFLGVAFFSGLRSTQYAMEVIGEMYFDETNLLDLEVRNWKGIEEETWNRLQATEGVKKVSKIYVSDFLEKKSGEEGVLRIFSMDEGKSSLSIKEGRLPKKQGECFADASLGYQVGDRVFLKSGTGIPVEGMLKQTKYRVVGVGGSSYFPSKERGVTGMGSGKVKGFLFVPQEEFQLPNPTHGWIWIEGAKKRNSWTKAYQEEVERVKSEIESALLEEELQVETREALPEYESYWENAKRMGAIGKMFPFIFFLVAALISLTGMTRMVEEERTFIGTKKALGFSSVQILGKYLGYAFLATILGSVSGVLVGEKFFPYLIIKSYGILYPDIQNIQIPYQLEKGIWATLFALICTLGATLFAFQGMRKEVPAQLMRPEVPKGGARIALERFEMLWKHLSFSWKSSLRNFFRYKKKMTMTITGIAGSMALILVGFGLQDSIVEVERLQYKELHTYDGFFLYRQGMEAREREEWKQEILKQKEIEEGVEVFLRSVEIKGKKGKETATLLVVGEEEFSDLIQLRNRTSKQPLSLKEGVILSEKLSTLLGVKDKEEVKLEGTKDNVFVDGITEHYLGHYLYMKAETYEELFQEEVEYNTLFFQGKRTASFKEIKKMGERVLQGEGVLSVSYQDSQTKRLKDIVRILRFIMGVLIVSAGALNFIVLYNLNTINLMERNRELATLKVLGFFDGEVSSFLYRENLLSAILGGALGSVVGLVLHRVLIQTVETKELMFGRRMEGSSFLYSFLITLAFTCFINGWIHQKIKQIDMISALKSVD